MVGTILAQTTVSGYVQDAATAERLIGATVYSPAADVGAVTDAYGYFTVTVPADTTTLQYRYTGYVLAEAFYRATPPAPVTIGLQPGAELAAAEVLAGASEAIDERVGMSTVAIPMAQYRTAPVLLGEPDPLKTLQLMPGVSGGAEGTAGLYVRGGSPDQNLILLDGVPIYNVSHAFGIFSVFNADAIQDIRLTKGGFPARFGGRLSSVLEVEMKDGPADAWRVDGAVGLTAARATVGGPVDSRTRVLVSARSTYFDAIYGPINYFASQGSDFRSFVRANFFDTYLKVRHDLHPRHRLYLSCYLGGDRFSAGNEEDFRDIYGYFEEGARWGNQVAALRWRWQVGPRAFLNTVASRSRYGITNLLRVESRDRFDPEGREQRSDYESSVRDYNLKSDLTFAPNSRHTLRTGAILTQHRYRPGELRERRRSSDGALDTVFRDDRTDATEMAAYVEHEWTLSPRFAADYGLHASAFRSDATYASLQPRLGLRYRLGAGIALKASYAQMTQYVNLVTTESLSLPTDLWVPSTARIRPQQSWQAAAALVKQVDRPALELSAEAFYKSLDGVVSYRARESFFEFDPARSWQDKVTQGEGRVYGVELLAQRKVGKTAGWVAYTYSRNDRTYADLNGGRTFPFRYDRRHDVSVLVTHRVSERVTLAGAWVFFAGNAYTLPEYRQYADFGIGYGQGEFDPPYQIDFGVSPQAEARNQFRVSDSHRLDLSVTLTKPKRWGERSWVFGLYNTYWNRNPVYISAKDIRVEDPDNPGVFRRERQFREVSLLPIVPSVSYQFRFQL